jgi:ubiquinone/menaquinone biosynthesis C-methylase UbiE
MARAQHMFDHHAGRYDLFAGIIGRPLYARVVADAARQAPQGGTVLDAGAGPGRVAVALAIARPDLTVHAVDLSPDMVRVARRRAERAGVAERVHVKHADVADLPLADASIDLVVSTMSFHHWSDVPGAAGDLRRVVRPGGRIWIYDFRGAPWARLAGAAGGPVRRYRSGLFFVRGEISANGNP